MSLLSRPANGQVEVIPAGSFIINMGVVPQTVGNGLKPYGMIYDLIRNYGVPIKWVVNPGKGKDGVDFTHAGVEYRGGPFIVPASFRTPDVNSRITYWQGQGVVGVTTTAPLEVSVMKTLLVSSVPNWTLDKQNGSIATGYFVNAGIPPEAHGGTNSNNWKLPSELTCCDDIFVMPHADPKWLTHGWLYTWNLQCKGSIWQACHSGSALENMYDPANPSIQTNFLSQKVTTPFTGILLPVLGSTAYAQNSLILWGNHSAGTLPYSYSNHGDPIMQFMGSLDVATQNGSEQIYIPVKGANDGAESGWRETTVVAVYDPDHPQRASDLEKHRATVIAYGRGFGDPNRGYVMMEAAHSHNKATTPANIAAQRAFFNFSFWAAKVKAPDPEIDIILNAIYSGESTELHFDIKQRDISEFTISWTSSCGGSFSPANSQSTTFTAPVVSGNTNCVVTVTLQDNCGRVYKASTAVTILCDLRVSNTITSPCFGVPTGGAITMNITNGSGPYTWTWTRSGGGSGSGTGLVIDGLSAGTYTVTVRANNGAGCPATFTVTLSDSPQIQISATPIPVTCFGGSDGAINVSVTGGTPGYTYKWSDGPVTANRSGLAAGMYSLEVTDSKGCKAVANVEVTQPSALNVLPTLGDVACYGANNGTINLAVSGGTPGYSYLWSDGNGDQNRSGLAPGSYSVTVTDAKGCTYLLEDLVVGQPSAALTLSETHVNVLCFSGATGSIDLTASGGTGPYDYSWTGPGSFASTSEEPSGLVAGAYSVTVTDARGCTAILQVTVEQPTPLQLSTVVTHPTCPPDASSPYNSDGAINLTVSGGVLTYSYVWTAVNEQNQPIDLGAQVTNEDLSGLIAGTYTVVVTDGNNCTATTTVVLHYLNPNPEKPANIKR